MNYLIRISINFSIALLISINLLAQGDSIITIVGIHSYMIEPASNSIQFTFVENGVTCGPNAQFESLDEQYDYFVYEIIKNKSISDRLELVDRPNVYFSTQPKRTYSFAYNSIEEMKSMHSWATEGFAENLNYQSVYPDMKLKDEDLVAIEALKDATKKALKIAILRGFQDVEIISIDDNTGSKIGLNSTYNNSTRRTNFGGENTLAKGYKIKVKYKFI